MNRKTKVHIYNIVVIAMLLCGIIYVVSKFVHLGNVEFTDNAYVHQHITPINSRVQGFIREIRFDEYTPVHKGDTLVIIEDTEFRLHVAQAEAALGTAMAGQRASATSVETVQSNIGVSDAAIAECKAQLDNARREDERYRRLLERQSVTQQQYDNVHTVMLATEARYEQMMRSRKSTSLVKNEQSHRLEQNDAGIRVAEAALDLARLNLSYTVILAPCDGVLGRKDINVGQLVQPDRRLLTLSIRAASGLWQTTARHRCATYAREPRWTSPSTPFPTATSPNGALHLRRYGGCRIDAAHGQCHRQLCQGGTAHTCAYCGQRHRHRGLPSHERRHECGV